MNYKHIEKPSFLTTFENHVFSFTVLVSLSLIENVHEKEGHIIYRFLVSNATVECKREILFSAKKTTCVTLCVMPYVTEKESSKLERVWYFHYVVSLTSFLLVAKVLDIFCLKKKRRVCVCVFTCVRQWRWWFLWKAFLVGRISFYFSIKKLSM